MEQDPGRTEFLQDLQRQALAEVAQYRLYRRYGGPVFVIVGVCIACAYVLQDGQSISDLWFVLLLGLAYLVLEEYRSRLAANWLDTQFAARRAEVRANLVDQGLLQFVLQPQALELMPSLRCAPPEAGSNLSLAPSRLTPKPVTPSPDSAQERIRALVQNYAACCAEAASAGLSGIVAPQWKLGQHAYQQRNAVAVEVADALLNRR